MRIWLDTGGGPVPPAEESLAGELLRSLRFPEPPSMAEQQRRARSVRQAIDAVRSRARGRTVAEVAEMLTAELAARGVDVQPSTVAWQADMLVRDVEPFGRLVTVARGLGMLGSMVRGAVNGLRHVLEPGPAWLRPPDRAAFRVAYHPDRVIAVTPDDDASAAVIARAHAASRRVGLHTCVAAWFTADGDAVAVHIGDMRVGTLHGADAALYAEAIRTAAAAFDEAPFVDATISDMPGGRPPLLEVPRPASPSP